MMALPMPSRQNETAIVTMPSPVSGMKSETMVTKSESITVFLRPIRFISTPVGTENTRNHRNTSEGKMLACESERCMSALT